MHYPSFYLVFTSVLLRSHALTLNHVAPTTVLDITGATTAMAELRHRQLDEPVTLYNPNLPIIGYISPSDPNELPNPIGCGLVGGVQYYPTILSGSENTVGCCSPGEQFNLAFFTRSCAIFSTCVDYSVPCGADCTGLSASTRSCSDSRLPYCLTFSLDEYDVKGVMCTNTKPNDVVTLTTDVPNEDIVAFFTTTVEARVTRGPSPPSTETFITLDDPTATDPSNKESPTGDLPNIQPIYSNQKPVGAIVGGVVGSLLIIGLVVVAIVWMRLRNKKNASPPEHQYPTIETTVPQYPNVSQYGPTFGTSSTYQEKA